MLHWRILNGKARNANIQAVISGYGATCDGKDRINPDATAGNWPGQQQNGLGRCPGPAGKKIDYISLDGLACDDWDSGEVSAIKQVFGDKAKNYSGKLS